MADDFYSWNDMKHIILCYEKGTNLLLYDTFYCYHNGCQNYFKASCTPNRHFEHINRSRTFDPRNCYYSTWANGWFNAYIFVHVFRILWRTICLATSCFPGLVPRSFLPPLLIAYSILQGIKTGCGNSLGWYYCFPMLLAHRLVLRPLITSQWELDVVLGMQLASIRI